MIVLGMVFCLRLDRDLLRIPEDVVVHLPFSELVLFLYTMIVVEPSY